MTDRVHQVRLTETHAAVDEERVISLSRSFRGSQAGGMSELVTRAHHELLKCIFWIERILDRLEIEKVRRTVYKDRRLSLSRTVGSSGRGKTLLCNLKEIRIG